MSNQSGQRYLATPLLPPSRLSVKAGVDSIEARGRFYVSHVAISCTPQSRALMLDQLKRHMQEPQCFRTFQIQVHLVGWAALQGILLWRRRGTDQQGVGGAGGRAGRLDSRRGCHAAGTGRLSVFRGPPWPRVTAGKNLPCGSCNVAAVASAVAIGAAVREGCRNEKPPALPPLPASRGR